MLIRLSYYQHPDRETFLNLCFQLPEERSKRYKEDFVILKKSAPSEGVDFVVYKFWILNSRSMFIAYTPSFYKFDQKTFEQANEELKYHHTFTKRFNNKLTMAEWLYDQYISNEESFSLKKKRFPKPARASDYSEYIRPYVLSESL